MEYLVDIMLPDSFYLSLIESFSASKMSLALFIETYTFVLLFMFFILFLVHKWFCRILKKYTKSKD